MNLLKGHWSKDNETYDRTEGILRLDHIAVVWKGRAGPVYRLHNKSVELHNMPDTSNTIDQNLHNDVLDSLKVLNTTIAENHSRTDERLDNLNARLDKMEENLHETTRNNAATKRVDESRKDKSRDDESRKGKSRDDESRKDKSRDDESRKDKSRDDESRKDKSRDDESRKDKSRDDESRKDKSRDDESKDKESKENDAEEKKVSRTDDVFFSVPKGALAYLLKDNTQERVAGFIEIAKKSKTFTSTEEVRIKNLADSISKDINKKGEKEIPARLNSAETTDNIFQMFDAPSF